ncbi:hypothetical protein V5O48_010252 [Marasmius crinis-equi]|uniref:Uncharacterized protein n=1 Tax=Marasmius crinis-equi TaxID=585013 RepID=A0ABR3F8U1_9AGAR
MLALHCFVSFHFFILVSGKGLPSTSSWRKPTITTSPKERINRAAAAIDEFVGSDSFFTSPSPMNGKLPQNFWPYGELLVQMADFDILTNQTRYKDVAQKQYLPAFQGFDGSPR